jgi:ketosteroid isomerase-like protein
MMRTPTRVVVISLIILIALGTAPFANTPGSNDEQAILDHIHSIFKAYMDGDEATIQATHSSDWTGFNNQSRSIVRGIEGYMDNAHRALAGGRIIRYELEDVDVQIHGDIGIIYYVANWTTQLNASGARIRMHVRSVDIYEKRSGHWIQIGSNLNSLTRPGAMSTPKCAACFDVELESNTGSR